jgi:CRISPR/Cas system-associated exonuclease Cas4 (RecB family)
MSPQMVRQSDKPKWDDRLWFSASRWKSLTKCGEQYRLEKIEKLPGKAAAWTIRGNAVHDTVEEWEKQSRGIDPYEFYREVAWPKALEETTTKYPDLSTWFRTPRVKSTERDIELRLEDGFSQVERYVERATAERELWKVIATEQEFEMEFPGILIRGKMDQIREWRDGDLSLWDVKTGGDDNEDNRQLGTYRLGYLMSAGIAVDWGSYWYTKLDRGSDSIDLSVYTYDYMNKEFQKIKKILDQGLFLANPSIKGCKFCPVADACVEAKSV